MANAIKTLAPLGAAIATMASVLVLSTHDLSSQDKAARYEPMKEVPVDSLPRVRSVSGTVQIPQVYSPNAASLGTYGKIPADLYHGLANVTIPLDSVVAKGYTLPIYLTYNTMGNRPEVHPGWVGQGWTLHAGGCIVRQVHDLPDDMKAAEYNKYYRPGNSGQSVNPGYLYNCNEIQSKNWNADTTIEHYLESYDRYDLSPDEFQVCIDDINASFYVKGHDSQTGKYDIAITSKSSGSFSVQIYIEDSYTERSPYQNSSPVYKVKIYQHIDKIIVTKDNGVEYWFGGTAASKEFAYYNPNPKSYSTNVSTLRAVLNTWYLTKIKLPNGECIDFYYANDGVPIIKGDNNYYYFYSSFEQGGSYDESYDTKDIINQIHKENINFSFLQPCYLTGIHAALSNDSVNIRRSRSTELGYDYNYEDFRDRGLYIEEPTYDYLRSFDYFMQLSGIRTLRHEIFLSYSNSTDKRLSLEQVSFVALNDGENWSYKMKYCLPALPRYNTKRTDAWGYYNNRNYGICPYRDLDNMRTFVDTNYIKAEMLDTLFYPTGGYTRFNYESNSYGFVANPYRSVMPQRTQGEKLGGGLRIKSLTDYDGTTERTRSFRYVNIMNEPSGIISGIPKFFIDTVFTTHDYPYTSTIYEMADENRLNLIPTDNGSYVTYSQVREILPSMDQIITEYYSQMLFMDAIPGILQSSCPILQFSNPVTSKALSRGLPSHIYYLDSENELVRREDFLYNQNYSEWMWMPYYDITTTKFFYRIGNPKLYYYQPYLKQHVIQDYPQAEVHYSYSEMEFYDYDDELRALRSRERMVGTRTETTQITYPSDISSYFYQTMSEAGFKAFPIEVRESVNGQLVGSALTTYKKNMLNNDYVVDKVYTAKLTSAVSNGTVPAFNGNTVASAYGEADVEFGAYDRYSNPLSAGGRGMTGRKYFWEEGQNRPSAVFEGVPWTFEIRDTADVQRTQEYELRENVSVMYPSRIFTAQSGGTLYAYFMIVPGYNWSLTLSVDGTDYKLAIVSNPHAGSYWQMAHSNYPSSVQIPLAPGRHFFGISDVARHKDASAPQGQNMLVCSFPNEEIVSRLEGASDVFYDGEVHHTPFTIELDNGTVPQCIDYKVHRNDRWEYVHDTFTGTSYTINEGNNQVKEIRAYPMNCLANSYEYDRRGHLISATNPMGATTGYEYDDFGRLTGVMDNSENLVNDYKYSYVTREPSPADGNCVTVKTYISANGSPSNSSTYVATKAIFDGLGREIRKVDVGASLAGVRSLPAPPKDIVSMINYDANGRPDKKWLPVACVIAQGTPNSVIEQAASSFYSDSRPFSQALFNAYPYSTLTTEYGPGEQWYSAGRKVQTEFLTNSTDVGSVLSCMKLSATSTSSVSNPSVTVTKSGLWLSGTLTVTRMVNEDNQTTYEFRDMDGNVVLYRVMTGTNTRNDTYYVYDSLNRLAAVLQPSLSASFSSITSLTSDDQQMKDYAFLYVYDKYGQTIAKRIPGAGWERFAYDKRGARVCSQTAAQKENNEVSFCLYDNLFRECIIGQYNGSLPTIDGTEVVAMPAAAAGRETACGYYISNFNLPTDTKYLTVNHYDNYGFLGANGFPASGDSRVVKETQPLAGSYGAESSCTAMGLPTGSLNAVLDNSSTNKTLWKVNYYDDRARVIQQRSNSHMDGRYETTSTCYDFAGNVTKNTLWHDDGQSRSTEVYSYTYDKWQRPLTTSHSKDGAAAVTLAENSYDAIGRLISTGRADNPDLATNIQYNIRSWVTSYGGPVFSETLHYIDSTSPQYGGNVSAVEWNRDNGTSQYGYLYGYDAMGRLTGATGSGAATAYSESYTYDRQYNMTSATRNGVTTQFGYSGNQQTSIGSYTCTYDSDGRQITNGSINLAGTTYNEIGLPKVRTYSTNNSLPNIYATAYSSDGTKLSATTIKNRVVSEKNYVGNLVLDGTFLDKTLIEGGYIDAQNRYHFLLKDHLGNVKVDVLANGTVIGTYDYYPYGDTFASTSPTAGQPYRFSGNEIDPFGTYDFIARQYAPSTGRFTTIDPLAEKYYSISPYAYCAGNPVNLVDPDGMDWYVNTDGKISWTEYHSQEELLNNGIYGRYLGTAYVRFLGSRNETLGEDGHLDTDDANLADVIVYGADGIIGCYKGFTMSSDFNLFGAIADGEYTVYYKIPGKSGSLKSNWAVNNGNPVDCVDGINNAYVNGLSWSNPYSATQKDGIYIHSSNKDCTARANIDKHSPVSTGCLLIVPFQHIGGDGITVTDWQLFNNQLNRTPSFKMMLNRTRLDSLVVLSRELEFEL